MLEKFLAIEKERKHDRSFNFHVLRYNDEMLKMPLSSRYL